MTVCNATARAEGVRRGQRRRDAQARCPEVVLLSASPERDARWFEPVLGVVEEVRPGVAPLRPGMLALPGPGRYFARPGVGGEEAAAAVLAEHLVEAGVWDCRFGVADDLYAAERAAREAPAQGCLAVPAGGSAEFLRGLPVTVLADDGPEGAEPGGPAAPAGAGAAGRLRGALGRLGEQPLRRLRHRGVAAGAGRGGHPAGLADPAAGAWPARSPSSHRWTPPRRSRSACGPPPSDSSRGSATGSLVATGVRIEAEFEEGVSARTWLHPRCFTSRDLVDRVHWQTPGRDGELGAAQPQDHGGGDHLPGDPGPLPARHRRAGLRPRRRTLGRWRRRPGGARGGAGPGHGRLRRRPGPRPPGRSQCGGPAGPGALGERPVGLRPVDRPWPGRIPGPAPSRVFPVPVEAEVVDEAGVGIAVTGRGLVTGEPWRFRVGRRWHPVAAWAGPWPVDDAWWLGPAAGGRAARFQAGRRRRAGVAAALAGSGYLAGGGGL
ncbi:DNA polymerase Y family protein [Nocardioides convexus]|uniref:Y-family DNA polymerase n=1 Tax=Nocardioides convexus TaxID=2712224 RepID=UPI0024186CEB|nr:DNA polymerase Y family protein [Nocardioides convexus]